MKSLRTKNESFVVKISFKFVRFSSCSVLFGFLTDFGTTRSFFYNLELINCSSAQIGQIDLSSDFKRIDLPTKLVNLRLSQNKFKSLPNVTFLQESCDDYHQFYYVILICIAVLVFFYTMKTRTKHVIDTIVKEELE
jgi:hypothetical protein